LKLLVSRPIFFVALSAEYSNMQLIARLEYEPGFFVISAQFIDSPFLKVEFPRLRGNSGGVYSRSLIIKSRSANMEAKIIVVKCFVNSNVG